MASMMTLVFWPQEALWLKHWATWGCGCRADGLDDDSCLLAPGGPLVQAVLKAICYQTIMAQAILAPTIWIRIMHTPLVLVRTVLG